MHVYKIHKTNKISHSETMKLNDVLFGLIQDAEKGTPQVAVMIAVVDAMLADGQLDTLAGHNG